MAAPEQDADPPHVLALRDAIERLPKKLRQVIVMHYLDETRLDAIAGLLALSKRAVEGRLYRARQQLRTQLEATTTARTEGGLQCL